MKSTEFTYDQFCLIQLTIVVSLVYRSMLGLPVDILVEGDQEEVWGWCDPQLGFYVRFCSLSASHYTLHRGIKVHVSVGQKKGSDEFIVELGVNGEFKVSHLSCQGVGTFKSVS